MTAPLSERRAAARRHAVDGLLGELRQWEGVSRLGGPLEKHRSQIDAVLALLGPGVADVRARLDDGHGAEVPARILDLHHVWDFYRTRLMLRRVREYRRTLDVADELAWQCYRPVLDLTGARPKEPPLTCFSRTAAPRAHRRGSAYHDLLPRGGIHTREGRAAAACLPFPVIEMPWHYGSRPPALLTVTHETAHHIEDDRGLGDELQLRVRESAGLSADRSAHWERWAGEAFADVCAAVVCGPAYAGVLTELLAGDGQDEAAVIEMTDEEAEFDGPHPPPATRVRLALAAARAAGHPGEYETPDPETQRIAAALLDGGYRGLDGHTLIDLLLPPDTARVPRGAARLLNGHPSGCGTAATVLAAAALAFQTDPAAYDTHGTADRAVTEVLRLRPTGSRDALPASDTDPARRTARAEAAVALLAALDATAEPGPTDGPSRRVRP
ncbi:hypothetical protein [Streptomyces sp. YIM S03343]